MRKFIVLLILLSAFAFFSHCKKSTTQTAIINGAGATFPYPVYSAWAQDYQKETGTRINYQSIGSGGGIKQIESRTVNFGASDKPLKPEELEKLKLFQFPAVIGGVVPVFNLKNVNSAELSLTPETLCGIYLGDIKNWDDKAIKEINPNAKLPNEKITVVSRSDGSGTTAVFTHYLSAVCPAWKEKVGTDTSVKFPTGIGAKGNEGVANYVGRVDGSIGYVEFAYAKQNNLKHVKLKNASGNFIEPSDESFQDAGSSGKFEPENHFYLWLTNAPGAKAWPIAGATFILLAKEKQEINKEVTKFFSWAFIKGDASAKKLIFVPLPNDLKEKIRNYWKANNIQ